ncbi:restriction endonuclease subunit S [Psychrobacter sp. 1U2]|uniref:restriction endonuclease subunit S n=1 Tax=Psychrobacter sp. 1U2 TaxID=3453577 RepID=UPI003F4624DD
MVQDKYSEYLDSELMWVREYPSHWSLTKVKYEAYVKARVGWHGLKTDDFTDVGPYLVTGSDFKSSVISWKDCYHCDLERYEQDPYIQLQNGDLLLTKDGTIGKIALVQGLRDDEKATLNSGVFVVRPLRNSFITEFYFWLLESSVFKKFVDYHKTGSTIVHLYQGTFVEFSYASPPLDEQVKIANFLDHETAKIDTLIEKQQTLIQLLKEKRQAVISHAVTKGLNPDAPMKDSGVEWLGEVPEHWRVCSLKHIKAKQSNAFVDGPFGSNLKSIHFVDDGDIFVIESNFATTGIIDESKLKNITLSHFNTISRSEAKAGDIIIAKIGARFGMSSILPKLTKRSVVSGNSLKLTLDSDICNTEYIKFLLQHLKNEGAMDDGVNVTAQPALSLGGLNNLPVLLPPYSEQNAVIEELHRLLYKLSDLTNHAEQAIQLMQERRTALISAAVTGKIDVRGWRASE